MSASLLHRGPDESGVFEAESIALGSRRLSIVDLKTGRQPLRSEDESVHLVCNGEIYNAPELRRNLERTHTFSTYSDVEVLIHLYEDLKEGFLEPVEGMFGLALWDANRGRLWVARDRAGEKPLFYAWADGVFHFASEIRALRVHPEIGREIDPEGLRHYLAFGYFPAPWTPYRGIRKLVPGTMASLDRGASEIRIRPYWSMRTHALRGARAKDGGLSAYRAAAGEVRSITEASVGRQLMGDVPIGVALSGGLDSGWIATVAAAETGTPLHTFTVSFADRSFDEGDDASRLARRLGTIHHVARADTASLTRAADHLLAHMDEPLGDPAVLPTFLLAEEARRHVKAILGGEGADELFGGYPTYIGHAWAGHYARLPGWLRERGIEPVVRRLPSGERKVAFEFLLKRFVREAGSSLLDRHQAWFGSFPHREVGVLLGPRLRDGTESGESIGGSRLLEELLEDPTEWSGNDLAKVLYLDFRTYLGEGLLTKIDRVSMACSLESRSPYLCRELVEFAAGLPVEWKVRGAATKRILRTAAAGRVPGDLIRRKKRGLSVPLASMFRHELKGRLLEELEPGRLDAEGYLDGRSVDRVVREHLDGRTDRARQLWAILSLVAWSRRHL